MIADSTPLAVSSTAQDGTPAPNNASALNGTSCIEKTRHWTNVGAYLDMPRTLRASHSSAAIEPKL